MGARAFDWKAALDDCRGCVCFHAKRSARALVSIYDEALRPSGLTSTQFSTLGVIRAHEPLTSTRLGALMIVDKTTLTRSLALLERDGLIRSGAGRDRREKLLTVSPRGAEAFRRAYPLWRGAQSRVLKTVGRAPIEELSVRLARLAGANRSDGGHER